MLPSEFFKLSSLWLNLPLLLHTHPTLGKIAIASFVTTSCAQKSYAGLIGMF